MTVKRTCIAVLHMSFLTPAACDGQNNFSSNQSKPSHGENAVSTGTALPTAAPSASPSISPGTVRARTATPTSSPDPLFKAPTTPQSPKEGCQAHFSGIVIGAELVDNARTSKVFQNDEYSDLVGAGFYPNSGVAFPKAVKSTFDGIAFDKDTKVTIFEKPDFKGNILFERVGPVIVNYDVWRSGFEPDLAPNWWAPRADYGEGSKLWLDMGADDVWGGRRAWDSGSIKVECRD